VVAAVLSSLVPSGILSSILKPEDSAVGINSLPTLGNISAVPPINITDIMIIRPLFLRIRSRVDGYQPTVSDFVSGFTASLTLSLKKRLTINGITSIATKSDEISENATVQAWSLNISPDAPCI